MYRAPHNENTRVQLPAILHLMKLGYCYFSLKDPSYQLDKETNIIKNIFKSQFLTLNPKANEDIFNREFTNIILELDQNDLGRSFFARLLGKGNSEYQLIDWKNFNRNTFHVASEVPCINDDDEFRPDITIFINGLPLSYIEVKQPNIIRNRTTGIKSEFERQGERFRNIKFRRFNNITQLITFSDNMPYDETLGFQMQGSYYATTSLSNTKFNAFKEERWSEIVDHISDLHEEEIIHVLKDNNKPTLKNSPEFKTNCNINTPLNQFLSSIYTKFRLQFFLQYGITYVDEVNKEGKLQLQKHIMRYPQFFATKAIVRRISEGMEKGIIWHTQGSGKTALAYFNVQYLTDHYQKMGKIPHFYFVVDRLDLAKQANEEFTKRGLKVKLISSRQDLEDSSKDFSGNQAIDIAVVNIQKFKNETNFVNQSGYDLNIQNIYFIDEAHRSYNPKGSYLANLYNSDKRAIKLALTGTPLIVYKNHDPEDEELSEKQDLKTTRNIFGDYIHKYYYNQSIADGYTLRLMREEIETEYKEQLRDTLNEIRIEQGSFKKKLLNSHPKFVKPMLTYILNDLKKFRIMENDESLGAMVVCDSSEQARELYKQFLKFKSDLETTNNFSSALILHDEGDKSSRESRIKAFKSGNIDILFVYSMLLTGFDAPRLKKLYLGRKIKAHNLLQTLTRVNRPYKDFRKGYVVDFADISQEFDATNQAYFEELNREYDTGNTGEDTENVFGSLFVSEEEVAQKIDEASRILIDYSTDNLELFSQEVSEIKNKQHLYELKKSLISIKENYNVARLLGHNELLDKIDINLISNLLNLVTRYLATLSLLDHMEDSSNEELLNLAMYHTEFFFTKVGESELSLEANKVIENSRRVAKEIDKNWDQKDPEWMSLFEEFQRILQKQRINEQANIGELKRVNSEFDKLYRQIRDLNQRDKRLANRFLGDKKYARTFKRLTSGGTLSRNSDLYDIMKEAKNELDNRVTKNEGILSNKGFFNQETIQISRQSMKNLNKKINPKIIIDLAKLLSDEYTGEYQS